MAKEIRIGNVEAHEKLTSRLFWRKANEVGYHDAGNVKEFVDASSRSLVTREVAEDGFRRVNDEQVNVNHEAYTFLLDERSEEQDKLILLARQLTDETQAAADGTTATISDSRKGRWHALGQYNIDNVQVVGSLRGTAVEGTDYELDKEAGRIKVLEDGAIADREDLTLTFDQPALTFNKFESNYETFYCDVKVEQYNQLSKVPLRWASFSGFLNIVEFPSHTGEFGVYRARITPSDRVTWYKRQTYDLNTVTNTPNEVGGQSSSSSSNSSSSSGHSSSSSSS